jgi:hypothetical protein
MLTQPHLTLPINIQQLPLKMRSDTGCQTVSTVVTGSGSDLSHLRSDTSGAANNKHLFHTNRDALAQFSAIDDWCHDAIPEPDQLVD